MESMMTARDVAEFLGVHENWVYDQAVAGDLPSYKIGGARRFDPEELRRWIASHREGERRQATSLSRARNANGSAGARSPVRRADAPRVEPVPARRPTRGEDQARLFET